MYEGILGIKKPTFGLDIGYETMKLVQVHGRGAGASLTSVVEAPVPVGSLAKEGIKAKQEIAQLIRQAMAAAKPHSVSAKIVSSALPESLVFTKILDLPKMSRTEIAKNVPYQATEFFPIPAEETYMDWQVIGEKKETNSMEIIVVAAPKVLVNDLAETVKLAGLELLGLETKPVAASRALISQNETGPVLLIDIGAKTSGLICYDQSNIKLTSTVTIGGAELQQNLATSAKALATEAMHLMKYYQNRLSQAQIFKKILLAGGGANIKGVVEGLEQITKVKTEIGLPIMRLKSYDPKFATALGLALKEI